MSSFRRCPTRTAHWTLLVRSHEKRMQDRLVVILRRYDIGWSTAYLNPHARHKTQGFDVIVFGDSDPLESLYIVKLDCVHQPNPPQKPKFRAMATTESKDLGFLFPLPAPPPAFAPQRLPGVTHKSSTKLVEILKENHTRSHIFFNDKGFHK